VWQQRHADSIAYLNPVVAAMYQRRRRIVLRVLGGMAAAAIFAVVAGWFLVPQGPTFAQAVSGINKAESITLTITWYDRVWSVDGKRSWLRKEPRWERSYLAPSRYRDVHFDQDGNVAFIDIEDVAVGRVLHLDMKNNTAMVKNEPSGQFGPGGNPFAGIAKTLQDDSIEYVGQREVKGVKVNVFRRRKEFAQGGHEITDFWLDAKTKRLVGYVTTQEDKPFDPATDPDRDHAPEKKFSKGTIAGVIHSDIVFDAEVDPKLFSVTPPEGFKVIKPPQRPKISENLMIEWLRLSALANDGIFLELDRGANLKWHNAIAAKPESERSEAEQQYMRVTHRHMLDGNYRPVQDFANEFTEARSFQYIGKGAKLGDASRIVCWYKLKGREKYRAVYGDLTAKEVNPDELPLPVAK
jgi:outer membrane lipoprotein-sorting protein